MTRKKFSPEFKAEAVRAVIESSRTVAEVARDHGIGSETLRNWVNAYRRDHPDERYNQKRLHSALQYRTPNEAEQDWYETNKAA